MAYSESQNRATQKYKEKAYKRVPLDVTKEFYAYLKGVADSQGKSVNGFIKEAIDEKCNREQDEIPEGLLWNLMTWLRDHGHTQEEIVECLSLLKKD